MKEELHLWNINPELIQDCCWGRYKADNAIECSVRDPSNLQYVEEDEETLAKGWKIITNARHTSCNKVTNARHTSCNKVTNARHTSCNNTGLHTPILLLFAHVYYAFCLQIAISTECVRIHVHLNRNAYYA